MKERLDRENIEALAAYRFQRAEETLKEIPYLKQQGYYNTAVNRLYYACYYAAVALLIKHELNPGTPCRCQADVRIAFCSYRSFVARVRTMFLSPFRTSA